MTLMNSDIRKAFKVPLLICPVFQKPSYSKLNLEIPKYIYL